NREIGNGAKSPIAAISSKTPVQFYRHLCRQVQIKMVQVKGQVILSLRTYTGKNLLSKHKLPVIQLYLHVAWRPRGSYGEYQIERLATFKRTGYVSGCQRLAIDCACCFDASNDSCCRRIDGRTRWPGTCTFIAS